MQFEIISQGFVRQTQANTATPRAGLARTVIAPDGDVVCTYVVQEALGLNDIRPMIARSQDGGETWGEHSFIWPHLRDSYAIVGSVSLSPSGDLFIFGAQSRIDQPAESFWCEATQGLKQNELFWARSPDSGKTWSDPLPIPLPIPGSAEAPGPLCIMRSGRWGCCYAPYNTFDPQVVVDRNQVVFMSSDDQGQTWSHRSMLRFDDPHSGGAEAWVIELADGRLLGTSWHQSHRDGSDYPNAYALSLDGGDTWQPTRSTGIQGQSTALAALPDGRALFIYNQRKHPPVGVWLALANPTDSDFGVQANEVVWRAETATQSSSSGEHSEWTDFAFGEPSITLLPDSTLLVVLWCIQPSGHGIRYLRLRMSH
ncbi:MAG: exo-alpha-sialidase [Armatimonadetes bacterium]|nr:exo-alpha-sialidase [Armatimonadota bacterium]